MRRIIALLLALAAAAAAAVVLTGVARSAGGPYTVRAIFDDASYAATGEDVEIAGANVGTITALGVTQHDQAAVTITIDNGDFVPFHANAHCTIRPQSLIGDEYVDCTPGTSATPVLSRITSGAGRGQHLLPVTRTSSPIDLDIVQDLSTEPVRESLSVILGELGTGLAARGSDLNAVIQRANPALGNTDRVIKILASQDRTLGRLATSSDAVLGPLAAERRQLAGFVVHANTTATATARQAAAISATFREFPGFLRQLRPLMAQLGTLARQGTPVMQTLGTSAGSLGQEFTALTPFARSARTALVDLGSAAHASQADLVGTEPLARRLLAVGRATDPSATSLQALLQSLDRTGGIEQLMKLLYEGTSAGNGFNKLGHYVRAEPITGSCTNYATTRVGTCSAAFGSGREVKSDDITPQASVVDHALRSAGGSSTAAQSTMSGLLGYLTGGSR